MSLPPKKRARGSNAIAKACFEATPGIVPAASAGWFSLPFSSHGLGEERGLIEDDLVGNGREMQDPVHDVASNDGDLVVPVDARNFGNVLKLFFGGPETEPGPGGTPTYYEHLFVSGASTLPSLSIEIGSPEVPAFSVHRGARGNQLKIGMARSGLLNATCSLIAIGETDVVNATVGAANPVELAVVRFPQAAGSVKKDGVTLGSVVSTDFTYSNNLEKAETITADGRIEDSDPGKAQMTGSITIRFADKALLTAASSGTPVDLSFGWTVGDHSLMFEVPRVFLPKTKRPITGPAGIQATFNFQASGALGPVCSVTLKNDVEGY